MGRAHVERDGVSVSHASTFLLVGTMNPEEGELRPQLLDRFGLTVRVVAAREVAVRAEVIRRRLAFEADPAAFAARLGSRRPGARAADRGRARRVGVGACCRTPRCAGSPRCAPRSRSTGCARTSWSRAPPSRTPPGAARPRSRRRTWRSRSGWRCRTGAAGTPSTSRASTTSNSPTRCARRRRPGSTATAAVRRQSRRQPRRRPGRRRPSRPPRHPTRRPVTSRIPCRTRQSTAANSRLPRPRRRSGPGCSRCPGSVRARRAGGRGPASGFGRVVRAADAGSADGAGLHLVGTVSAAAPHQRGRGRVGPGLVAARGGRAAGRARGPGGQSRAVRRRRVRLDGGQGPDVRCHRCRALAAADAYQRRDKVGVVTFRGTAAEVALPPTSSVDAAARRLRGLTTGGRTPLADGLLLARRVLAARTAA